MISMWAQADEGGMGKTLDALRPLPVLRADVLMEISFVLLM
jgi:hypothetical protein